MVKNNLITRIFFIIMGIGIFSFIFVYNFKFFCTDNYNCIENIKDGIVLPFLYLIPSILISLIILFFVSSRLKMIGLMTILIISIPVLYIVFNSPVSCSGFLCDRMTSVIFLIPFYPIITFLSLIISFIYFRIRNKRSINTQSL